MAKFNELVEFLGGGKEIEIFQNKFLTIYPLKIKDLTEITENRENLSEKEKIEVSNKLILKSLKDESVTLEQISELPAAIYSKIMEEINDLNGFNEQNERIKLIEKQVARSRKE